MIKAGNPLTPDILVSRFIEVCKTAEIKITAKHIPFLHCSAGKEHRDTKRQKEFTGEKCAAYVFINKKQGVCYKVGKAHKNSAARILYHHYNPGSSQSNLADSLLNDVDFYIDGDAGEWIKDNTDKIIFTLDLPEQAKKKPFFETALLNFLEAFLQLQLEPKYEGFESQR